MVNINTIYQMDCLEYLKSLPDGIIDCCIIDEPYMVLKDHKIESGYNLDTALQVRQEIYRVLKKDAWFLFFGQFPSVHYFYAKTLEAGFQPWNTCNEIVWCKRCISSPFLKMARIHESIFVFQKGSPEVYENKAPYEDIIVDNAYHGIASWQAIKRTIADFRQQLSTGEKTRLQRSNAQTNDGLYKKFAIDGERVNIVKGARLPSIWSFVSENRKRLGKNSTNYKHPTVKPVLLLRRLIKLFTKPEGIVLDCFAGSGTTLVASLQEGRNFYGCERDIEYCKVIQDRVDNWESDLEKDDEFLEKKGVNDFKSDIEYNSSQDSLF